MRPTKTKILVARTFGASWRSSLAGYGAIACGIGLVVGYLGINAGLIDGEQQASARGAADQLWLLIAAVPGILNAIGNIFSKDERVTSQKVAEVERVAKNDLIGPRPGSV